MCAKTSRYVIISPVKNEEKNIGRTIESVLSQSVLPCKWVFVDDASTDATVAIVEKYSKVHRWMVIVHTGRKAGRARGARVVQAFAQGYRAVEGLAFEYVLKLDGDIGFEATYLERIFSEFERNPRLGISSGISYIRKGELWREEKSARGHTLGASKVYRRQCFEEIGGLVPCLGWDGIDEIKAKMKRWEAKSFPDLPVRHYRPEGRASGLMRRFYEDGQGAYFMGYHPLFMLLRSAWRMKDFPFVIGGLLMLLAYLVRLLERKARIDDRQFVRFLRREQIKKIQFRRSLV